MRATKRTSLRPLGPVDRIDVCHPVGLGRDRGCGAWRLGHLLVGVLGARNAYHFGGPPTDYTTRVWPATAADALAELDVEYARWQAGVAGLDAARLADPIGPAEGPWADRSYADLVLHINRELIHHGAEIGLLRDLWAAQAAPR